jgi:hypothetical protein
MVMMGKGYYDIEIWHEKKNEISWGIVGFVQSET